MLTIDLAGVYFATSLEIAGTVDPRILVRELHLPVFYAALTHPLVARASEMQRMPPNDAMHGVDFE